ncbi:hypothetical protein PCANC_14202 [Puccinia coronata f. sp. avenae]|uniref:DDE Tnp4 domain-containing protein n=1 Tax=Puccinia coronata f. sp. avenae TaxID=200324 RepID=A0A2N5SYR2_9BASI|nr:hypothetical protein PCANC_14202 [Puccinia coronata f. sp. avenae]
MKAAIKWIISCVVLHNLLADLKDQWNELYKEEEPEPAPPDASQQTHRQPPGTPQAPCHQSLPLQLTLLPNKTARPLATCL